LILNWSLSSTKPACIGGINPNLLLSYEGS
jgi:hypothetical protein